MSLFKRLVTEGTGVLSLHKCMAHRLDPGLDFAVESSCDPRELFVLLQCLSFPISEMDTIKPNGDFDCVGT